MNIYDIARESGYSTATVSRVINGSDKVTAKAKAKVMAVIEAEGYTPNVFAQGMGSDSMKTVGVLVPDISDDFMSRAVSYLETGLVEKNFGMILSCSGFTKEGKEKHISMLMEKRVDALILVGSTYAGSTNAAHNTDIIREAAKTKPVFLINAFLDCENVYCTFANDFSVTYDVTKRLLDNGRQKILFLTDSDSYSANQKKTGYLHALQEYGYEADPDLIIHTKNDIAFTRELMKAMTPDVDACLATDDAMAVGVIKYALDCGISIPNDLSVIGYNNSALATASTPELTSIDNRLEKNCQDTLTRLFAVLSGSAAVPRKTSVACTVAERETTAF